MKKSLQMSTPTETTALLPSPSPERRQRASNALTFIIMLGMGDLTLYLLAWGARYYLVDLRIVFCEFPFLQASDIPYYVRPGFHIDLARVVVNSSFEWWVYASNLLDLIPLVYVPTSFLIALLCGFKSIYITGVFIVLVIIFLLQLAKASYFTLYMFSLFGLHCEKHPFCINRDPVIDPSSPDVTFSIETFVTWGLVVLTFFMLFLPYAYREATRATDQLFRSKFASALKRATDGGNAQFGTKAFGQKVTKRASRSGEPAIPDIEFPH